MSGRLPTAPARPRRRAPSLAAAVAAVAATGLVAGRGQPARADARTRTELLAAIDARVRAVGEDLAGAVAARDAAPLAAAAAHLDEAAALVDELAALGDRGGRAPEVVRRYPGYVAEARAALEQLRALKSAQRAGDGLPAQCARDAAALLAPVVAWRQRPGDAVKVRAQLAATAAATGERWAARLAQLDEIDRIAASASAARCAAADAYWMDVTARVNAAAEALGAAWRDGRDAARAACAPLALGARHPEVAPLLAELERTTAAARAASAAITADVARWLGAVRAVRAAALAARARLRDGLCAAPGDPLAELPDLADHLARELAEDHRAARAAAAPLAPRVAALGKDPAAAPLAAALRAGGAVLDAVQGDLAGHASPALRRRLAAARARREATLRAQRCAARDLELSAGDCGGAACRIDCLQVGATCAVTAVVAARPGEAPDAHALAGPGADGLRSLFARDGAALLARAPAARACLRAEAKVLELEERVATYDACGGLVAAELGARLPELPADPAP